MSKQGLLTIARWWGVCVCVCVCDCVRERERKDLRPGHQLQVLPATLPLNVA